MNSTRCASSRIQPVAKPSIGSSASVARLKSKRRIVALAGQVTASRCEQLSIASNVSFGRKYLLGSQASSFPHRSGLLGILKHPAEFQGEGRLISRRHEKTGNPVFDHIW